MKKTYFKPEMLLEQMEAEEIIAVSLVDVTSDGNDALSRDPMEDAIDFGDNNLDLLNLE